MEEVLARHEERLCEPRMHILAAYRALRLFSAVSAVLLADGLYFEFGDGVRMCLLNLGFGLLHGHLSNHFHDLLFERGRSTTVTRSLATISNGLL